METEWVSNYIVKMVGSGVGKGKFEGGSRGSFWYYALVYPHNTETHECFLPLSKMILHTAQHISGKDGYEVTV